MTDELPVENTGEVSVTVEGSLVMVTCLRTRVAVVVDMERREVEGCNMEAVNFLSVSAPLVSEMAAGVMECFTAKTPDERHEMVRLAPLERVAGVSLS